MAMDTTRFQAPPYGPAAERAALAESRADIPGPREASVRRNHASIDPEPIAKRIVTAWRSRPSLPSAEGRLHAAALPAPKRPHRTRSGAAGGARLKEIDDRPGGVTDHWYNPRHHSDGNA